MEIQLSYTNSENNAITKNLNSITSYSGTLRDACNVIEPVILIEGTDFSRFNYAYIPSFKRYYFITKVSNYRNGVWVLTLHVDVLMTYRTDILNLKAIIDETETYKADNYLPSSDIWVAKVKDKTSIINFPNGLSQNGEYVLLTAGGNV